MATVVLVPPLGQTVDTVTLVSWYRAEGETVSKGESLFAIETDKATLDIEAPASGVLRQVAARPGDLVQVLTPIAAIAEPGELVAQIDSVPSPGPALPQAIPPPSPLRHGDEGQDRGDPRRIFASPRARRLAGEHGIPLEVLQATGPQGAIVERDVRAHLKSRAAATAAESDVLEPNPVRGVRETIALPVSQSMTSTAPVTLNTEADAAPLVDMRRQLARSGLEVSDTDLLLAILGKVLREQPRLNATLEAGTIKVWKPIHIGLAIDTDQGLLIPVIRDVDRKGLLQLSSESQALIERARARRCTPEELRGGTFTLTNLGMFGVDSFTSIINPTECAILGVGRIRRQRTVWLSLTFDHRLVDGAPAARFLQRVVQLLECPHLLLA